MRVLLSTLFFVLFAGSAFAGYERINQPDPADKMNVGIYQLDNGLTVYLSENHETPRFYSEIVVRAGSKTDPANTTGLAHYLEHLLFKGTRKMGTLDYEKEKPFIDKIRDLYEAHFKEDDPEKRKAIYKKINATAQKAMEFAIPNEFDKLYNAMGASKMNAHTSVEETVYKSSLPGNRIAQWCKVESERFVHPVFRLFHTELETVYEEKNRSMDNKGRLINDAVYEKLFKVHPYGQQTTLGTIEDLKRPSLVNIRNYFETYYVPNNMAICISGDIEPEKTMELIDQNFGTWKSKDLPKANTWKEEPLKGVERSTVQYPGEPFCMLAFRTVPNHHEDAEALAMIDMILSNSEAGLIDLNLNQQQRVRMAGSYPRLMNDAGVQHFYGIPKKDQSLAEVEKLMLEQVALVKKGAFEDWIIPAIITDFKKSHKMQLESDSSRVATMRDSYLAHEDWSRTVNQIARIENVTREDIIEVANRYYGENYVAGYREDGPHKVPGIEKPHIDPLPIDPTRQSAFAKEVLAMPVEKIEPVYIEEGKHYTRREGKHVDLYHSHNPINDLFSLSLSIEVGSEHNKILPTAAALIDKSGAKGLTPSQLAKEWYKRGSKFKMTAGSTATQFVLSGLDEKLPASLELMMNFLQNPTAGKADLAALKQNLLVQREDSKKNPETVASALSEFNKYGAESRFLKDLTADKIYALSVDELFAAVNGLLDYKWTIYYTGSLSPDEVIKLIEPHLRTAEEPKANPPYPFRKARSIETNEIYFFDKTLAQSQIRIEFADGIVDESDRVPSRLYNNYFGAGMSSVVFQEIREARGLAYSAYCYYIRGNRTGQENLLLGGIGTQTDKTLDAMEAFIDLIDNIPVSEERFTEAQASIVNRYRTSRLGFRDVLGAVHNWELLDIEGDPRKNRFAKVQAADLAVMTNFHANHIKARSKLISIVGDASKIDMESLGRFGTVKKITLDQLFVD